MYEFSYNDVVEDSPRLMREREYHAFDKVIQLLDAAQTKSGGSRETIEAIYYLRNLWAIILQDLEHPGNELPGDLRAGLVSIGQWMMREIDRVGATESTNFASLIEINEIIRDGLM